MSIALFIIGFLLLGSAAAAMLRRNLIHSALLFVLNWACVAALYLWAGAEFVAFAQILVYVGAVSMVALFAVLLTSQSRDATLPVEPATLTRAASAFAVAASLAAVIGSAVSTARFPAPAAEAPSATVKEIGLALMSEHGAALLIVGLILTVALIGAIVIASTDKKRDPEDAP
jgi:NADH:ubiquinone oxidoreductase subunit 6 (subunit J)